MAQDKQAVQGADDQRIDTTKPFEVRSWAEELGVSVEELHAAIAAAGTNVEAVRQHLQRGRARSGDSR
jgi:hypothetical protein